MRRKVTDPPAPPADRGAPRRARFRVTGTVQGVGFRPFVYRLAVDLGLQGFVRNTPTGVEIEAGGEGAVLDAFARRLCSESPPAARIVHLERSAVPPGDEGASGADPRGASGIESDASDARTFVIEPSGAAGGPELVIPPDIATCDDCLAELLDPRDRRYRYPFINCTNCGPRYTIVRSIPYDRPATTMAPFTMCPECRAEYGDPMDRRFHAQPDACADCGPSLKLLDAGGRAVAWGSKGPIPLVVEALRAGKIVAVQGIGGFHLAVDATREGPVERLRRRKRREEKPFAIMAADLEAVRHYARVAPEEARLLTDPARPIVLLERRPGTHSIARAVAPGNRRLGVMLPYTPIHALLFSDLDPDHAHGHASSHASGHGIHAPAALVMTSANLGEEPIVRAPGEAMERLGGIADLFLTHDREIHRRADDSVVRIVRGRPLTIRRSRGYVPIPVRLRDPVADILAFGAHLKNTICITRGRNAWLSPHIGDLENDLAADYHAETIAHLERILDIRPRIVAHDLHPDYRSTRGALARDADRRIAVQHHHAHIAACLAENGARGPVIGVACDGTGLGEDGTIWGGEILRADLAGYERIGHLEPFPLPGGDAAAREAWRPTFSLLRAAFPDDYRALFAEFFPEIPSGTIALVDEAIERGLNAPMTSSLGRLFDAVSAITGVARRSSYEGQAAIALEQVVEPGDDRPPGYRVRLREEEGRIVIRTDALIRAVLANVRAGTAAGEIARRFHGFVIDSLFEAVRMASDRTGLRTVALSGGCFQNAILVEGLGMALEAAGLEVLTHSAVPPGDGGIALGQAVVAAAVVRGW